MTEPSPYRCETCEHKGRTRQTIGGNVINCDKYGLELNSFNDQELIIRVGCASHSNHQSKQSIRQDEREKVARMMGDDVNVLTSLEPDKYSENWYAIQFSRRWIAALRSGKQEPK